jgi:hypothetical protein
MMDVILFLARHTPFWAVPMGLISAEFVYIFWFRDKKKLSVFFTFLGFVCLCAASCYFWAGGPEKFVKVVIEFVRQYS